MWFYIVLECNTGSNTPPLTHYADIFHGGESRRVAKFLQESILITFDFMWKVLLSDRDFATLLDLPLFQFYDKGTYPTSIKLKNIVLSTIDRELGNLRLVVTCSRLKSRQASKVLLASFIDIMHIVLHFCLYGTTSTNYLFF